MGPLETTGSAIGKGQQADSLGERTARPSRHPWHPHQKRRCLRRCSLPHHVAGCIDDRRGTSSQAPTETSGTYVTCQICHRLPDPEDVAAPTDRPSLVANAGVRVGMVSTLPPRVDEKSLGADAPPHGPMRLDRPLWGRSSRRSSLLSRCDHLAAVAHARTSNQTVYLCGIAASAKRQADQLLVALPNLGLE